MTIIAKREKSKDYNIKLNVVQLKCHNDQKTISYFLSDFESMFA